MWRGQGRGVWPGGGGHPLAEARACKCQPWSIAAVAQHRVPEISALLVSPFVKWKGYDESTPPIIPQGNNVFHLERTSELFIF